MLEQIATQRTVTCKTSNFYLKMFRFLHVYEHYKQNICTENTYIKAQRRGYTNPIRVETTHIFVQLYLKPLPSFLFRCFTFRWETIKLRTLCFTGYALEIAVLIGFKTFWSTISAYQGKEGKNFIHRSEYEFVKLLSVLVGNMNRNWSCSTAKNCSTWLRY